MRVDAFSDEAVPVNLLRERAFNLRWAEQPPDVIPLTAADPDFPIAPAIRERIARHALEGVMSYGPPLGLPRFRDAVAGWMREMRGIACSAGSVMAADSAASAMVVVARASLRPGDEVLIPDPVDFLFRHAVQRAGAVAVPVPLSVGTTAADFVAALASRLTPRTRMLWLCNPHNPLGLVHARPWLEAVLQWALGCGLRVLSDEVWSDIVYAPHRLVSPAALSAEAAGRIVTIYGFSKGFALAGLRVGCIVCTDPAWFRAIAEASDAQSTVYGVSTLSQVAATAALEEARPWLQGFVHHLQAQRDFAVARLRRWPGVQLREPQGTYVLFPEVRALDADAERLCADLKEQARVALVPGAERWFGRGAAGHLRLCFATSRRILETALDRIDGWLERRGTGCART